MKRSSRRPPVATDVGQGVGPPEAGADNDRGPSGHLDPYTTGHPARPGKGLLNMQHDQVVLAAESSRAGIKPLRFKRLRTLAAFASGALVSGGAAAQESDIELETLKVEDEVTPDTNPYAEPGAPYLGKRSADPRRTRPLAEIPQTITVLTGTQIEETGRSDLKEILDGQPGITLGTGEGGNAFGDRYIIRGHEARSDMFVDGIRDPGMTIRESFAVEQLEITKGSECHVCRSGINRRRRQCDHQASQHGIRFHQGIGRGRRRRIPAVHARHQSSV